MHKKSVLKYKYWNAKNKYKFNIVKIQQKIGYIQIQWIMFKNKKFNIKNAAKNKTNVIKYTHIW